MTPWLDELEAPAEAPVLIAPANPALRSGAQPAPQPTRDLTRVLHVINGEHYAGAERVQDLLAAQLIECGYRVDFACLKPGAFDVARKFRGARVFDLGMRNRFDLTPAWKLARLVKQQDYRLVHTHTPRAALVGRLAAMFSGVPLVHHLHSPTSRDSTRSSRDAINARVERWSCRQAKAVLAVSDSMAEYGRSQQIPAQSLTVIPNGVPILGPLVDRATPCGHWTIGCVALFRPRKGIETLLDAIAILLGKGCDVSLRAVGVFETPEYEQQIHSLAARLQISSQIEWVGFSRNVTAEMSAMDLFVLPSLFGEGLPMVLLEAMAAGAPVVATRVEGVPQAIRDGQDGLLAVPASPNELAEQIYRVITGKVDWQALRASAWRRQAECFSDRRMAQQVAEVYRRLNV
jgi:glycosyltransferase involved in cell wall biosynthesis